MLDTVDGCILPETKGVVEASHLVAFQIIPNRLSHQCCT